MAIVSVPDTDHYICTIYTRISGPAYRRESKAAGIVTLEGVDLGIIYITSKICCEINATGLTYDAWELGAASETVLGTIYALTRQLRRCVGERLFTAALVFGLARRAKIVLPDGFMPSFRMFVMAKVLQFSENPLRAPGLRQWPCCLTRYSS